MKREISPEEEALWKELSDDFMQQHEELVKGQRRACSYGKKNRYGVSKDVMWQFMIDERDTKSQ